MSKPTTFRRYSTRLLKNRQSPPSTTISFSNTIPDHDPILPVTPRSTKRQRKSPINVITPPSIKKEVLIDESTISKQTDETLSFQDLCIPPAELRPSATLTTGQCFHWRVVKTKIDNNNDDNSDNNQKKVSAWGSYNETEWIGTLRVPMTDESIVVLLRETPNTVLFRTIYAPESINVKSFLYSYFQLPNYQDNDDEKQEEDEKDEIISLELLYNEWSLQCNRIKQIAKCIPGVRIIDQDPFECLISFICSSNNNIPRITKILNSVRQTYGTKITTIHSNDLGINKYLDNNEKEEFPNNITIYSFPTLETLIQYATEEDLRNKCGLGYRAKYIIQTIQLLNKLGGEEYLQKLRLINDPIIVQEKLIQFPGIGRKVADCIALFSLLQYNAIPVDVHVWNIVRRDYNFQTTNNQTKTLTPTIYKQIGDLFRTKFPSKSGWAHSLLFVAELPSFRDCLPKDIVEEMDKFRLEEKEKKAANRATKQSTKETDK